MFHVKQYYMIVSRETIFLFRDYYTRFYILPLMKFVKILAFTKKPANSEPLRYSVMRSTGAKVIRIGIKANKKQTIKNPRNIPKPAPKAVSNCLSIGNLTITSAIDKTIVNKNFNNINSSRKLNMLIITLAIVESKYSPKV